MKRKPILHALGFIGFCAAIALAYLYFYLLMQTALLGWEPAINRFLHPQLGYL
ncbi:hypothetical protein JWZ98_03220 [Methylomonas sp. EFPC1]|uniref:hypothetical protein n=1 Tax=Methylomonas sp. EFPC1 TaxID=2812647 RepID=UPI001967644D|nr:hypothetical protein [Methylomonas sp. EFPC1]QSB01986.1 hypothetical protein JWZ98_03220 [Methylomonas sp. EFPC1]